MQKNASEIEDALEELLPSPNAQNPLTEAMRYSTLKAGKRVRPFLVRQFSALFGGDDTVAIRFGCALEMIHCYSLIHDDLPCMDDDDYRRGKPSCHAAFDEATALLAGDALLTLAFSVASTTPHADAAKRCNAVMLLSECSGWNGGMIGGQMLDLLYEDKETDEHILNLINDGKTGGLLRCAALLGCVAAGAGAKEMRAAEAYAKNIGRAFQIIDDILDVLGDRSMLGKPVGSDEENHKSTFAKIYGTTGAFKLAKDYTDIACSAIAGYPGSDLLIEYAMMLLNRKK
ncbi:MAG: polyprenyl synthetase family protein [Ruminococcaceae bacterium]|nr:polyprenyl synthetase family protein [Oscillospiraceae bacterium]